MSNGNMGNGCHVMQYPSKRWGFVGRVPRALAWVRRDGKAMTDADWNTVAHCMAPGSFGYGPATFATEADARAAYAAENTREWTKECAYISDAADVLGKLSAFNHDTACFVRYCEMQRDSATRKGFDDAAQYIQHCIDDMGVSS